VERSIEACEDIPLRKLLLLILLLLLSGPVVAQPFPVCNVRSFGAKGAITNSRAANGTLTFFQLDRGNRAQGVCELRSESCGKGRCAARSAPQHGAWSASNQGQARTLLAPRHTFSVMAI